MSLFESVNALVSKGIKGTLKVDPKTHREVMQEFLKRYNADPNPVKHTREMTKEELTALNERCLSFSPNPLLLLQQILTSRFGLNIKQATTNDRVCEKCGHKNTFADFVQLGMKVHGEGFVKDFLNDDSVLVLRLNESTGNVCGNCAVALRGSIYYDCDGYGGCCMQG
jgi:hypothetical protein